MSYKNINLLEMFIIFIIFIILSVLSINLFKEYRYEIILRACIKETDMILKDEKENIKNLKIKECIINRLQQ